MREVVFDVAAHALELFAERRRQLGLSCRLGALRFVREDRERGLQPVREVPRLRDRAPHGAIAVLEQRVQIVDQRLHLRRIRSVEAALGSVLDVAKPPAHALERRQRGADEPEAGDHCSDRDQRGDDAVLVYATDGICQLRMERDENRRRAFETCNVGHIKQIAAAS